MFIQPENPVLLTESRAFTTVLGTVDRKQQIIRPRKAYLRKANIKVARIPNEEALRNATRPNDFTHTWWAADGTPLSGF